MSEKAAPGCAPGACSCTGPEECWRKGAMTAPSVSERLRALPRHACDETTWHELRALATEIEEIARELPGIAAMVREEMSNVTAYAIESVAYRLAPRKEGT